MKSFSRTYLRDLTSTLDLFPHDQFELMILTLIEARDDVSPENKDMFRQLLQMQQQIEAGIMPGQR